VEEFSASYQPLRTSDVGSSDGAYCWSCCYFPFLHIIPIGSDGGELGLMDVLILLKIFSSPRLGRRALGYIGVEYSWEYMRFDRSVEDD
jgi:uncharacterized membrane protein